MTRILPTILVLVLLAGTAAAFAVTERLKLERGPIAGPEIDKVFSPVCDCSSDRARIAFRLRRADTLRLALVDGEGRIVRRLVGTTAVPAGRFEVSWDGRDDAGAVVPEGSYRPRLHLRRGRRTIILPNPIRVDVTAPEIQLLGVTPTVFSPDGDGRNEKIKAFYSISERARPLLYVDGVQRVRGRLVRTEGKLDWYGRVDGRELAAGRYGITLSAEDPAGNVAAQTGPVAVTVRYIELGRDLIRVRARMRFGVRVKTDARSFRWRFAGRTGIARPGLLVLRAPKVGRYGLYVTANGRAARARVIVVPRRRSRDG